MSQHLAEFLKPIDRRKILKAEWRTIVLEDGTVKYNSKPNDPLYFSKYYDLNQLKFSK